MNGFLGLPGDDDEVILISILSIIIKRYMPDEMEHERGMTMAEK